MEFEENEDQEEEIGIQVPPVLNYEAVLGNSGRPKMGMSGAGGEGVSPVAAAGRKVGGSYRYRECLKNHAVGIGGHAVDGCGEFLPAGDEGTLDALKCAACNCHRNFHRKEGDGEGFHHQQQFHHPHHHPQFSPYYRTAHPAGYLHVTPPPHQRPLALPSTSREDEDMSNPSSSGGGGSGGGSKKRFRTKFTQEQKDKMLLLAENLGWRIQKQDEASVQQFCAETGVKRHVLKVWMHNNKHTLGKKP
ncbi:Zinc-finger homeodomain protein 1 [Camellia lanceoleosa]|uniref:Zinc-finger homeodomain protein 1 n=1 Tax=Camellia lanceoleosa TaxID=1840588 RepID=A0ACC0HIL2_9ERIC|nr:Zinc-finger homeodomain protein 1 [Camellia lanceoleosa]